MGFSAATLLLACAAIAGTSGKIKFIGTYDWAAISSLGENVTFNCVLNKFSNSTDQVPALPDNTEVVPGTERWQVPGSKELEGPYVPTEKVDINGPKLTVKNISMHDKGIFLCHVELQCIPTMGCSNQTEMWFKHGLNLNGPFYANWLDKYTVHFITAAASSGGVLGFFLLSCLIYKFRYKEHESDAVHELYDYRSSKMGADGPGAIEEMSKL